MNISHIKHVQISEISQANIIVYIKTTLDNFMHDILDNQV